MRIKKALNRIIQMKGLFFILAVLISFSLTYSQIDPGKHAKVLEPIGGETYKVGDTVHIRFLADSTFSDYDIKVSVDSGKTFGFQYIDTNYYYEPTDPDFLNKAWVIPETLLVYKNGRISKVYMVSEQVVLQIDDLYNRNNESMKYNSGVFAIKVKSNNDNDDYINPANYPNAMLCEPLSGEVEAFTQLYKGDAPIPVGLTPPDPSNPGHYLSPVIDGNLEDSIWFYSKDINVNDWVNINTWQYAGSSACGANPTYFGPMDLHAIWRFMYNNEGLFVSCQVHDDIIVDTGNAPTTMGWWNYDAVQIAVDPYDWGDYASGNWSNGIFRRYWNNSGSMIPYPDGTQNDFVFLIHRLMSEPYVAGLVRGTLKANYNSGDEGTNFTLGNSNLAGIIFAVKAQGIDEYGRRVYTAEFKFPFHSTLWEELEQQDYFDANGLPQEGKRFKMNFANCDADLTTPSTISFSYLSTQRDEPFSLPSHWSDVHYMPSFIYQRSTIIGHHPIIGFQTLAQEQKQVTPVKALVLTASPNPFKTSTFLNVQGVTGPMKILIFSITGKKVAEFRNVTNGLNWDTHSLPSGVYHVRAEVGNKVLTRNVLLQK